MSHYIADITDKQISKVATKGFTLATKIKKGKELEVTIDSSSDMGRYTTTKVIQKVTVASSGRLVHLDVGADEPIEVKATDFIKVK